MAPARRLNADADDDGAVEPMGLHGAVVRAAGSAEPVSIDGGRFLLVANLDGAREVLTRDDDFTLPFDVARQSIRVPRDQGRTTKDFPPLSAAAAQHGREVFVAELDAVDVPSEPDALQVLRLPVARSTTASVVPDASLTDRDRIAELVLDWVDALAPIISADRPPARWSAARRTERGVRRALFAALRSAGVDDPAIVATALAAGVQVPIAAGAWCLVLLAHDATLQRRLREDPSLGTALVWEVLRLYPPTWLIARITTRAVEIGQAAVPAYRPVVVSPVALGRLPDLVPGPEHGLAALDRIDVDRWAGGTHRPGTWLPFGAGRHACPGRSLGLAQLVAVVGWAGGLDLEPTAPLGIDADRGLAPAPSAVRVRPRRADS